VRCPRKRVKSNHPEAAPSGKGGGLDQSKLGWLAYAPCVRHPHAAQAFVHGTGSNEPSLLGMAQELQRQNAQLASGNLQGMEEMLLAQANTLDTVFTALLRKAAGSPLLPQMEGYMRLALKAQAQARATVETLAEIKNPAPVAFVRQANIGQAVQVNNGPQPPAREIGIEQNELSGAGHVLRADQRTPAIAGKVNSPMETVAALDRAKDATG